MNSPFYKICMKSVCVYLYFKLLFMFVTLLIAQDSVLPKEFQSKVWARASRLEVRCRTPGTAAGGRRAACRVENCTGTGSGTVEYTGCCPCYGSHSLQRMC